jgi:chromosome segregation ATPase
LHLHAELGEQLRKVKDTDKLREATITRMDQKLNELKSNQQRHDKDIASQSARTLQQTEELQKSIKRLEQMESRMLVLRQEMEDEFRRRHDELDDKLEKKHSDIRTKSNTLEDSSKKVGARVINLESMMNELAERLQTNEEFIAAQAVLPAQNLNQLLADSPQSPASASLHPDAEKHAEHLSGLSHRMGLLETSCHDLHVKFQYHEARSDSISKRIEADKEAHRQKERELHDRIDDVDANHSQKHGEYGKKTASVDGRFQELSRRLDQLQRDTTDLNGERETNRPDRGVGEGVSEGLSKDNKAAVQRCESILREMEAKLQGQIQAANDGAEAAVKGAVPDAIGQKMGNLVSAMHLIPKKAWRAGYTYHELVYGDVWPW